MSETPGVTMTGEFQELIVHLVRIDTKSKEQKYILFKELYDLWKMDLAAGTITAGNKFSKNVDFIQATILNSYDEIERNSDRVYRTLASGSNYTTNYGLVLPSNQAEISRAYSRKRAIQMKVTKQFKNLAMEFDDLVKYKG